MKINGRIKYVGSSDSLDDYIGQEAVIVEPVGHFVDKAWRVRFDDGDLGILYEWEMAPIDPRDARIAELERRLAIAQADRNAHSLRRIEAEHKLKTLRRHIDALHGFSKLGEHS